MSVQTIQTSAFPEERPDEIVKEIRKRARSLEAKLRDLLEKEGPYNFCKMAEEIRGKTLEYCQDRYNSTPEEVWKVSERIFAEYVLWRETIESFLRKCRTVPGYNISKLVDAAIVDRQRKKNAVKSGWVKKPGKKKGKDAEGLPG